MDKHIYKLFLKSEDAWKDDYEDVSGDPEKLRQLAIQQWTKRKRSSKDCEEAPPRKRRKILGFPVDIATEMDVSEELIRCVWKHLIRFPYEPEELDDYSMWPRNPYENCLIDPQPKLELLKQLVKCQQKSGFGLALCQRDIDPKCWRICRQWCDILDMSEPLEEADIGTITGCWISDQLLYLTDQEDESDKFKGFTPAKLLDCYNQETERFELKIN